MLTYGTTFGSSQHAELGQPMKGRLVAGCCMLNTFFRVQHMSSISSR